MAPRVWRIMTPADAGAEHERGQQDRRQVPPQVLPRRHVAGGGQPAEAHREEQDQHDAEPEVRHREAGEREQVGGDVDRRALARGRHDAGGDADQERDQHRADARARRSPAAWTRAARRRGCGCAATRRSRRAGPCRSRSRTARGAAGRGGTSARIAATTAGSCSSPASAIAGSPGRSCWSEKISTETTSRSGRARPAAARRRAEGHAGSELMSRTLEPDDAVRVRREALDLAGEPGEHAAVPQDQARHVAQQDLGGLVVELLALGGVGDVARLRQERVDVGVAVLAVVLARRCTS